MNNFADRLLDGFDSVENPICIGLDPRIKDLPNFVKEEARDKYEDGFEAVGCAFFRFNEMIINETYDLTAVYKPQMAFYEKYGAPGVKAFKDTCEHIKRMGCLVIEDAKRNDIKSTAKAYSDGHLGVVELIDGSFLPGYNVDAITVNPYLGSDCIKPFVEDCKKFGKGIFVLVKTSNPSAGEFQDLFFDKKYGGRRAYEEIALRVDMHGKEVLGDRGYSSVGAVVGATYPEDAVRTRQIMENALILVPGYGHQGGLGKDTIPNFNKDGCGAIINNASNIDFAYKKDFKCKEVDFAKAAREATEAMIKDISTALKEAKISRW